MKLGTGFVTCQRRPDDDRSMTEIYDEMLTLTRATEAAGLDSMWVSEHHFSEDGYLPGTMPSLAAMAAETERIEIGTYIALGPFYDPVRLAEDAATVDLLSGGRLTLGLAIGYRDAEFEGFGVPKSERAPRTEDAVRVLRGAWSHGPLDHDPEFHPATPDVTVTPKPEGDPRILLGGMARPAVRRAARMADGWAGDAAATGVEGIRKRVEDIRRVRDEEGLDGEFTVYVAANGFVGPSREAAWETMKEGYFHMRRTYDRWLGTEASVDDSAERRREARENAIFGTPEQVTAELERFRDALGDDVHFIFKVYYPGIGTDAMVEAIELLGDEVAPRLR